MIRRLALGLLDLVYPTKCIFCRRKLPPGRPSICPECQDNLPLASSVHVKGDFFSDCIAVLYYENDARSAILRFKFGDAQVYRHVFGELVAQRVYEEYHGKFDVLSWVPIAKDRYRKRGYDQVELIAQNVSKRLCVPLEPLLKKKRGVAAQSTIGGKEKRRANIAGAYRLRRGVDVSGKRILLLDDIVTTGSTLSECAKTLLLAGAEEVICATLAVASH